MCSYEREQVSVHNGTLSTRWRSQLPTVTRGPLAHARNYTRRIRNGYSMSRHWEKPLLRPHSRYSGLPRFLLKLRPSWHLVPEACHSLLLPHHRLSRPGRREHSVADDGHAVH